MIPTSAEFKREVQGPQVVVSRVDVIQNDVVVGTLAIHSGSVHADKYAPIRRTISCQVSDPLRKLTPGGAGDMLNPTVGTQLRPYRGVRLPVVAYGAMGVNTSSEWAAGTRAGTSVDPVGDLVLGNI